MKLATLLRPMLNSMSDAVVLFDGNRVVRFLNSYAEKLTGFTSDEATGLQLENVCRLVDQPTRTTLENLPGKAEEAGGSLELAGVTVIESKAGPERLVTGTVFVIPVAGEHSVAGGVILTDVTTRWMMSAAVLRSRKVEFIRTLIQGMVYNQEDLLTALLSNLSSMERSADDPGVLRRLVAESERIVGRISTIGSGMLAASSAEISDQRVTLVSQAFRNCLVGIREAFPEIQIEVAFPDRTGYAEIPPDLFEQVINCYLINAVEAQGGSGILQLTACRLDLPEELKPVSPGSYVLAGVRDYGEGIPENEITRVFEPFFSTKGEGRGFGLASTWSITHNFGGYITLTTDVDTGSSFGVYIPLAKGMDVETAADRLPTVTLIGFSDELIAADLMMKLEGFGCIRAAVDEEAPSSRPELTIIRMRGPDDPRWTGPTGASPSSAVLYALDEDEVPPGSSGDAVPFINEPYPMLRLSQALASIFWQRDPEAFIDGRASTSGSRRLE